MILFAVVCMAVQDALASFLVVAQARNRYWLAGICDAGYDYANKFAAAICGAVLVKSGFGSEFILVSALACTSFFVTTFSTKLANSRMSKHNEVEQ